MKLGVPSAPGLADALGTVFLERPYHRDAPYAGAVEARGLDPDPDLQAREADITPLPRQQRCNALALYRGEFHLPVPPHCSSRK